MNYLINLNKDLLDDEFLYLLNSIYEKEKKIKILKDKTRNLEEPKEQFLNIEKTIGEKNMCYPYDISIQEGEDFIKINGYSSNSNWVDFLNYVCKKNPNIDLKYKFYWPSQYSWGEVLACEKYVNKNGELKRTATCFYEPTEV